MKLEKTAFEQKKYNRLIDYANANNMTIVDKGDYYETVEIAKKTIEKSIEELKQKKLKELKNKKEEYKKTIFIKKDISLHEIETGTNNYQNLLRGKFGWTSEDLKKYDEELEKIVDKYDNYKLIIKNAESKKDLDFEIIFS